MLTKAATKYLSMAYYAWKTVQDLEVLILSNVEWC